MQASDRVLVTGASGFVGSAVVRALVARGASVRALIRPTSSRANLASVPCEIFVGDMRDPDSMRQAARSMRYVFHVAADYRLWAREPAEITRNNITGTRTVMDACRRAEVERVVYTSSVATLKPGNEAAPSAEDAQLAEGEAIGAYKQSKIAAERLVERMIREDNLDAVIVLPSTPIGPRDVRPTPTGRIVVEAASGSMPAYIDTGLNLVHVDDVAYGHILALETGTAGERYILGGQNVRLREMLTSIAALTARKAPRIRLPCRPLYPFAHGVEALARLTGKEPFLTVDGLTMARHLMYFTSKKAERELGYRARPYRDALVDAIAWFRKAGYLGP